MSSHLKQSKKNKHQQHTNSKSFCNCRHTQVVDVADNVYVVGGWVEDVVGVVSMLWIWWILLLGYHYSLS